MTDTRAPTEPKGNEQPPPAKAPPAVEQGNAGESRGAPEAASCEIPPGSYTAKYTKADGSGATCSAIPDQTVEIKQTDGGAAKPADGCTTTEDKATCTFTTVCTIKNAGYTTVSSSKVKTKGTITGSSSSKTTKDADGTVLTNCNYDFSYTKK